MLFGNLQMCMFIDVQIREPFPGLGPLVFQA